jgi:transcriptional regulator with GAF, ATPase, and Fis domain
VSGLPTRYEALHRLGAGGGGEVWSVRDRVSGRVVALKVLAREAGEPELDALVREAVALSGLEGLGVPRVAAFGTLADGRRYMVRELVEGISLEELLARPGGAPWLPAIASACDQLTVLHRAGFLHGDVKPANVIVGPDGAGTLVDLGLAAPWRDGGTAARGLTPKYAAPELLRGEPLTVRAEVYAVGATLREALALRGDEIGPPAIERRAALEAVAARATESEAAARWPSADELASALRRAAGLPPGHGAYEPAWPVLGLDPTAEALGASIGALPAGGAIALEGPRGSGRTTLLRRLAWTLGAHGQPVALVEPEGSQMPLREVVELELAQRPGVVLVDDAERLDEPARAAVRAAAGAGARLVLVAGREVARRLAGGTPEAFAMPRLEPRAAAELLSRSAPSLPDAIRAELVERTKARPGALRAAVRRLAGRAIVSREDVDAALATTPTSPPPSGATLGLEHALDEIDRALDMGRFDDAARCLDELAPPEGDAARVRAGLARARVAIGRGDAVGASGALASVERAALAGKQARAWSVLRARAALRAGEYAQAGRFASDALAGAARDPLAAEALSVRGLALAFTGEDAGAQAALENAVRVARELGDPRVEGIGLGSAAIAHQRAGRTAEARATYEASITAAEKARDAATVAAGRLNLANLARTEGDLAQALAHLEAAVDMGQRAGSGAAVTQARFNLASLDLFLGRWARARGSIDRLAAERERLSAAARAQLLGLEAEYATRTGDAASASRLYEETAVAWEAQGRAHDAAEARLEGLLARAREPGATAAALGRELDAIRAALGDGGLGEHAALAALVRGSIAHLAGDEETARGALDAAIDSARRAGQREWTWQALHARARLSSGQGGLATAMRDTEAALAMLEETAARLPRDLREVFWDEPRRRALRQAHAATVAQSPARIASPSVSIGARPAEDRLARVLEITRELATERDMPRLLERVTDHAIALLGAERGFVLLVGDDGRLETHTSRTRAGADDAHALFSRSVAEKVVETGEPVVTLSARDDSRLAQAVSVHQLMIQSIACVPVRGAPPAGRTIGVLYVETRLRPGARFEQEVPTLRAFADQAAIAIENARLLAENRARADELAKANVELEAARDALAKTLGRRTEQLAEVKRDLREVRAGLRGHFGYAGLVGTSAAMRKVYALIDRVKDTDVPLLVTGESGTGKEVVARAVHQSGPRAKKEFLGVNCGAIPANLLESELFGSVRGAFTGADRDRKGLFREADGGTLLLDEIGEMPLKMQAGLLRVLQEKRVRPVGANHEEPVDVRVIAATHRELEQMVKAGTFREDLYYRLDVIEVRVPPLRERVEDIPPLIDHFLTIFAARYRRERKAVSREALRRLSSLPWPGNVRQLEHVLLGAWLMSDGPEIEEGDLDLHMFVPRAPANGEARGRGAATSAPPAAPAGSEAEHKERERERILAALTACSWNRVRAAKMLGLPRRTFYRRLKEFGIL